VRSLGRLVCPPDPADIVPHRTQPVEQLFGCPVGKAQVLARKIKIYAVNFVDGSEAKFKQIATTLEPKKSTWFKPHATAVSGVQCVGKVNRGASKMVSFAERQVPNNAVAIETKGIVADALAPQGQHRSREAVNKLNVEMRNCSHGGYFAN
jgi:hypothetical protein